MAGILRSTLILLTFIAALSAAAPAAPAAAKTPVQADYVSMQAALVRSAQAYNAQHPQAHRAPRVSGRKAGLTASPRNTHVYVGATVTFECDVADPTPGSRVHWYEYALTPGGNPQMISDNENLLPGHPNAGRYRIVVDPVLRTKFHLEISGVSVADGGAYACMDAFASIPDVTSGLAELIVLVDDPDCATNIDPAGVVMEFQSYSATCRIFFSGNIAPNMAWTGPEPHQAITIPSKDDVFSGVYFTVDRAMDAGQFTLKTNFTRQTAVPPGVADNAPDYEWFYNAPRIYVYWEPKNMYVSPTKPQYEVGETISCWADAFPPPYYGWLNMRTNEVITGQNLVVDASHVGFNTTMRCQAQNLIQGMLRSANLFISVIVPLPTTPTLPATTVSTTPPPLVSDCRDLSGWWRSEYPYAEILLSTILETGKVIGYMRNFTDQQWVEVVGRTRVQDNAYIGISAIWPYDIGITGMSGECHRCSGEEVIITSGLRRSFALSPACGVGSIVDETVEHTFFRVSSSVASVVNSPTFSVHKDSRGPAAVFGVQH
jgi:hypothetical protein